MKFIICEQNGREFEFLLSPGLYIVGRDSTCDVTLNSRGVSRRHMSCSASEGEVLVKDLGSRNGIRVGGVQVSSADLKDGDELEVGDARLVFVSGDRTPAAGPPPVMPPVIEGVEPQLEDEEVTPVDEALLPALRQDVAPQLVSRDGRWFVSDPATGREVAVVPAAGEAAGAGGKPSLLSSTRGRIILGAAAALVVVLMAAALMQPPGQEGADARGSGYEYNNLIDRAVEALDAQDVEKATSLAREARAMIPDKSSAPIVLDLAAIWEEWQSDYFAYYLRVDELLQNLRQFHVETKDLGPQPGPSVSAFIERYTTDIARQRRLYAEAHEARALLANHEYEAAWDILRDMPAETPVRTSEAGLFVEAEAQLRQYWKDSMRSFAENEHWRQARETARKLGQEFPDESEALAEQLRAYGALAVEKEAVAAAAAGLRDGDFARVRRELASIPASSRYRARADDLLENGMHAEKLQRASDMYDGGDGGKALEALEGEETAQAMQLSAEIRSVLDAVAKAEKARETGDLLAEEEAWNMVEGLTYRRGVGYRNRAQQELNRMSARRKARARELAVEAQEELKAERFEKARELASGALRVDPDHTAGSEVLAQMTALGQRTCGRAATLRDDAPDEALRLLNKALRLLPMDDPFYARAVDMKRALEAADGAE